MGASIPSSIGKDTSTGSTNGSAKAKTISGDAGCVGVRHGVSSQACWSGAGASRSPDVSAASDDGSGQIAPLSAIEPQLMSAAVATAKMLWTAREIAMANASRNNP